MSAPDQATIPLRDALRRATDFHAQGNLDEAERWLNAILAAKPDNFDSLHLLALVNWQRSRFNEAGSLLVRALGANPKSAKAHANLAGVLLALGRRDEALEWCDRALALDADFATAYRNRAAVLKDLRRLDEALDAIDGGLARTPASAEMLNIRGAILQDMKRLDEAIASYDRALAIQPDFADALSNRGGARSAAKRYTEALTDCDRAIMLKPGLAGAHYHRGLALTGLERHDEAEASYRQALAINSDFPMALLSHAGALGALRRHHEAAADLERALALDPGLDFAKGMLLEARMHCCDWRALDALRADVVRDVRGGKRTSDPFAFLAISDSPRDQLQCARTWTQTLFPPARAPLHRGGSRRRDRVHIAYLSADFREHAVAFLGAGLFEQHDRTRFETTALSYGADDGSAMRARLTRAFERFVDVRQRSDHEIASLMAELDVDIAVDLGGLTGSARTGIFALRPAPVQVNFLGFTGTMGAPYIDYIVADRTVIPEQERDFYAERVVYLPDSFQANDSRRAIAEDTPARSVAGLPDDAFVFCSFNNAFKIEPATFALWMRVLNQVPGSVLWLLGGNEDATANLRREAAALGVAPERLVFAARAAPADHLARHRLASLFLDTLPFNAHTTASDALWAGLPVLTCEGTTFAGRVAASLVRAVGLPELVAHSPTEYEALAVRLATHADELAGFAARLAANRATAPLFDTDRYRRHLEAAYLTMWERHLLGEGPASFAVPTVA